MRYLGLVLSGGLFCALAACFADHAAWVELTANGSLPYAAVPPAAVLVARRAHVAEAAVQGAAASVVLVVAFYATTAVQSAYPLSMDGPYLWTAAGLVSGALLGVAAWWLRPRLSRHARVWGLAICGLLAIVETASTLRGPTSLSVRNGPLAGQVVYTTADLVLAALVSVVFCCALVLVAIRLASGDARTPAPA